MLNYRVRRCLEMEISTTFERVIWILLIINILWQKGKLKMLDKVLQLPHILYLLETSFMWSQNNNYNSCLVFEWCGMCWNPSPVNKYILTWFSVGTILQGFTTWCNIYTTPTATNTTLLLLFSPHLIKKMVTGTALRPTTISSLCPSLGNLVGEKIQLLKVIWEKISKEV